jgi:hypothetical protein
MAAATKKITGPPFQLTLRVVDDQDRPGLGAYVRVIECCHTEAGPCGRIPVDDKGFARFEVCPKSDGLVRITLTPDPKLYRVPPISEFEIKSDAQVTVTVTRHENVLRQLKKE